MRLKAHVRRIRGSTIHSEGMILNGKAIPVEDMPPAAWVELAREGANFYLYRFTSTGEAAGDTWHESLEAAKEQARVEYDIQGSDWVEATK